MLAIIGVTGCQKDYAENWAATYDGTSANNNLQRIVISEVGKNTLKLDLQTLAGNTYVTFATIGNGKLTSATKVDIDEDGSILGNSGNFHFTGTGTLSGNTLTMYGLAVNKADANEKYGYEFTGNK